MLTHDRFIVSKNREDRKVALGPSSVMRARFAIVRVLVSQSCIKCG
jgi:hypothetical protein